MLGGWRPKTRVKQRLVRTEDGLNDEALDGDDFTIEVETRQGKLRNERELEKQVRKAALIRAADKTEAEVEKEATAMMKAIKEAVRKLKMGPHDRFYIGIGALYRCLDEDDNLVPLSRNESVAALLRDNTVIRNADGSKLGAAGVQQRYESGQLEIIFASDANGEVITAMPVVADRAEFLTQRALDGPQSTIRTIAAGTSARRDGKVDKRGICLFFWLMRNAAIDKTLSVATVKRGPISTARACEEAAARAKPKKGSAAPAGEEEEEEVDRVRLVRYNGDVRIYWCSQVCGGVWSRVWGRTCDQDGFGTTLDFGVGGHAAALKSHEALVKRKKSDAPSRVKRGQYRELGEYEPIALKRATRKQAATPEEEEWKAMQEKLVQAKYASRDDDEVEDDDDEDEDDEEMDEEEEEAPDRSKRQKTNCTHSTQHTAQLPSPHLTTPHLVSCAVHCRLARFGRRMRERRGRGDGRERRRVGGGRGASARVQEQAAEEEKML